MKKTIWIINQYASTPETGLGGRHFYLARELGRLGHNVYVIASSANHLLRESPKLKEEIQIENREGFKFVWIKMREYSGAHSKQRVLNWFGFMLRLPKLEKVISDAPDVIIYSSPAPIGFLGAERLAKKFSAKLVFEVRDIWPLTLVEIGGLSRNHPLVVLMRWVEKRAYKNSDLIISNLENAVEHMVELGMPPERFNWVPNGFSLAEAQTRAPLDATVLDKLPKDGFVVGYTGTLGVANAMDTLIYAAEKLKDKTDIYIVLVGKGKELARLRSIVSKKDIKNVIFIDPIPKVQIQSILSRFDVCYLGWLRDELYRFGIAANKIPEYLYSGKPVIHSYSGACDPIAKYAAGVVVESGNVDEVVSAVLNLYYMRGDQREGLGANGRRAALEYYEYETIANKLEGVLSNI